MGIARSTLVGAVVLGGPGCLTGLAIGWWSYPPTAWAAVAEVGIPSALSGAVLGAASGLAMQLARRFARYGRIGRPRSSRTAG